MTTDCEELGMNGDYTTKRWGANFDTTCKRALQRYLNHSDMSNANIVACYASIFLDFDVSCPLKGLR